MFYLCMHLFIYYFNFYFGYSVLKLYLGSQFLDQGLNLGYSSESAGY